LVSQAVSFNLFQFAEETPIMTRVFVFTNHKGGVGKSTSATNTALGIAGMLRRAGAPNSRVLLIDTDSQAHATLVTDAAGESTEDEL
jgi:cellulose biosynthesis protein BcsQ